MTPIVFSAPARAGVVGNPSDIYGGSVVSITVPERARVTLTPQDTMQITLGGDEITLERGMDFRAAQCGKWTDIGVATVRFFAQEISKRHTIPALRLYDRADADEVSRTLFDRPFRLSADTAIPVRAGLSGSAALFGGLISCVLAHMGVHLGKHHLAETLKFVEQNVLGTSCGYQDYYMTVFGGVCFMDFRDKSGMRQTDEEPLATLEDLSWTVDRLPFVVAHYGGIRDQRGIVHRSIRERWMAGEELAVRNNRRIGELGRLGKKALLAGNWARLAELMNENHSLQQELGGSFAEIDRQIEVALELGARAAKLAGGGCGGTLIALHDDPVGLGEELRRAGARFVTIPRPEPGVRREDG